jgi:hypothetical protein
MCQQKSPFGHYFVQHLRSCHERSFVQHAGGQHRPLDCVCSLTNIPLQVVLRDGLVVTSYRKLHPW